METITHRYLNVNGIKLHVAEKGPLTGPVILLLHGFPDLWYTWRYQILELSAKGYRTIAPDLRGYGESSTPSSAAEYTCLHIVGDLVALVESLELVDGVFVVGHDWGAMMGWYLCLFRPDLVKAFVSLTVPFRPRNPKIKPVAAMRAFFGDDYYICRFQGDIEDEIERHGAMEVLKTIITSRKPGPCLMPKENPFGINLKNSAPPLPIWFSEEDLNYYTNKFEKTGFAGGLNYYRAFDLTWELTAPWTRVQVKVPVKFMVGDLDLTYTTPGVKEYVHGGGFKHVEKCRKN